MVGLVSICAKFLAGLEVAEKFVGGWVKWLLCLTSTRVKLNWSTPYLENGPRAQGPPWRPRAFCSHSFLWFFFLFCLYISSLIFNLLGYFRFSQYIVDAYVLILVPCSPSFCTESLFSGWMKSCLVLRFSKLPYLVLNF